MKLIKHSYPVLVLCLLFSVQSFAQGYTPPSQERVNLLLENLENCKKNIEDIEKELQQVKENPEEYTYARYLSLKNSMDLNKKCVESIKTQLDKLRKDYPGWFNSPEAFITAGRHGRITPGDLGGLFGILQAQLSSVIVIFVGMEVPEH